MGLNSEQLQVLRCYIDQHLLHNEQYKRLSCTQAIPFLRSIMEDRVYYEQCQCLNKNNNNNNNNNSDEYEEYSPPPVALHTMVGSSMVMGNHSAVIECSWTMNESLVNQVNHWRFILSHECPQNMTQNHHTHNNNNNNNNNNDTNVENLADNVGEQQMNMVVSYMDYKNELVSEKPGLLNLTRLNDGETSGVTKADVVKFISQNIVNALTEHMLIRKKQELAEQRQSRTTVDEYWSIISPSSPPKSITTPPFSKGNSSSVMMSNAGSTSPFSLPPIPTRQQIMVNNGSLDKESSWVATPSQQQQPTTTTTTTTTVPPVVPIKLQQQRSGNSPQLPPPIDKDKLKKGSANKVVWEKPCILLVGDSGAGKSSLINTVFGTEEQVGVGKPVTQEIHVIEREELVLIDSKGFEKESEGIDAMQKLIDFLGSRTLTNKVHMVWYIIASDSARVQDGVKEVCDKYFKDIPTFFILTKCDKIAPRNLQVMRKAVEMLKVETMAGIYAVSDRPPVILDYPRLCPRCPDTNMEPVFNKSDVPQSIFCTSCKNICSACKFCDNARLLLDTTEQNWFCRGCKNDWEQMTTSESELDELIVSTYHKFTLINEQYAALFRRSLVTRHLKLIASGVAGAVGVGITGAVMGASVGGLLGAAVGMVGGTIAGAAVGAGTASIATRPPPTNK